MSADEASADAFSCQPLVGRRVFLPRALQLWQETTGNDDSPRRQARFLATARQQTRFPASHSSADAFSCRVARWPLDSDGQWYYLSQVHDGRFGHLVSGWLWDRGFWYHLSESHDGSFGRMLTGWQQIDGYWYYLRERVGDPLGSCALDTVIDGWRVDASGRWIA